jgi:hypothetical protein
VDAQVYYDVPILGGLILRGEYVFGTQPGTAFTSVSPAVQPATPIYKRKFSGYYLSFIQNVGNDDQVVFKYDVYDPNTAVSGAEFRSASNLSVNDLRFSTLGIGVVHHWDANVKFTLYHELVFNERLDRARISASSPLFPFTDDIRDDVLTFRIQFRF